VAKYLSGELSLYERASAADYRAKLARAAADDVLRDAAAVNEIVALLLSDDPGVNEVPDGTVSRATDLAHRLVAMGIVLQNDSG